MVHIKCQYSEGHGLALREFEGDYNSYEFIGSDASSTFFRVGDLEIDVWSIDYLQIDGCVLISLNDSIFPLMVPAYKINDVGVIME